MPSREPEVGSLKNFPMARPPEPPAAFVSCQQYPLAWDVRLKSGWPLFTVHQAGRPACGPYGLGWNQADLAAFYPVRDDRAGLLRNPGSSPTDFLPNHRGKSIGVASSWMARFPTALLSIL